MLLLLLTDALADDTFQPDESEHLLSVTALQQTGAVRGRTGRLLLQSSNPEAIAALPEVAELRLLPGGLLRLTPKPGIDDLALSRRLHARADVAWVHPDFILPLQVRMMPNDPLLPQQWHLENTGQNGRTPGVDINAPLAWDYATGAGQTIAVLDSGVQADHPDLRLILGHDYIDKDEDPSPGTEWSAGHGTSCSGIAAAIGNNDYGVAGVAWDAEVYGIRLIGGSTTTEDVYDAFVEAVDQGAGVLSNSWGYSEDCTPTPDFRSFKTMFEYAETKGRGGLGSVVTFAAGNGNCDISEDGLLTHETVVVVAAVESNDIRASYSDFGTPVDISAPTTLLTTDLSVGGFGSYNGDEAMVDGFNGTSAATPVVSGVVARM